MDILISVIVGIFVGYYLHRKATASEANSQPLITTPVGPAPAEGEQPKTGDDNLYKLAEKVDEFYERSSAYPDDLLELDDFKKGVELLRDKQKYSIDDLFGYATGVNVMLACMALEALSERDDMEDDPEQLFKLLSHSLYWPRYFVLKLLHKRLKAPMLSQVLSRLDDTWTDNVPLRVLKEFIKNRLEAGDPLTFGNELKDATEGQLEELESLVKELGKEYQDPLKDEIEQLQGTRIDKEFLKSFGEFWFDEGDAGDEWISHEDLRDKVDQLEQSLQEEKSPSVILVGEQGVGKTAIARCLGLRLKEKGWHIFEAGSTNLLAGQMYIGQLEERVQNLVQKIGGKRKVLWVIPNFHELMWAGTHKYSPMSLLDMLFPYIEKGDLLILGETHPTAYERLVQNSPRLRSVLQTITVQPLPQEKTIALAQEWVNRKTEESTKEAVITAETLAEAFQLTQQYMGDKAAPGNLLQFINLTWKRMSSGEDDAPREINLDDLLVTLSQLTGLPINILDDRQGLDLTSLESFFHQRVLGQPEAIHCLVERVAMIKAGLTDPTRPQGVFLFAGPTGTGKTEIAKTLAEFLFGSEQRMIRLDMSEFQTPMSIDRIIGEGENNPKSTALVNLIRKQPFSVVLLDEFEKSDPNVWDLFLQVFDDGRLTDRRGNTADFRHCIIIMTSNLGGAIPTGTSIGFTGAQNIFTSTHVDKAITKTFRKEFINRIDRIIIFQPLSRTVMREILRNELQAVMQRRGLRNRTWAVEWHDSAIEFLLDKGFTPDLGARPLKRAIERFLLSPLSMTIVNHQFPEGDQFLFVRSKAKQIEVEFIDPDTPDDGGLSEAIPEGEEEPRLESILLDPAGTIQEAAFLKKKYEEIEAILANEEWESRKADALSQTARPGFWESPERFATLGLAEYMDRIESGFNTAKRLLERLIGNNPGDRKQFSVPLVQRLSQQLYLIDSAILCVQADHIRDAFILVEAGSDTQVKQDQHNDFARQVAGMYRNWVEKRRMRFKILSESNGNDEIPYRLMMAVAGYASLGILENEQGLHVLEIPAGGKSFRRCKTHVRVVPQPIEPAGYESGALLKQATEAFAKEKIEDDRLTIIRRYREAPSPLVRDSRKWRTGRLDRVLGGDFDLFS